MLETEQVSTTAPTAVINGTTTVKEEAAAMSAATAANNAAVTTLSNASLLPWESDPVKLESTETFDDFTLTGISGSSGDFAELKPLPPYEYSTSSLTIDPVLPSNNNNNNTKGVTDLNLASPTATTTSTASTTNISITVSNANSNSSNSNNNNVVSTTNLNSTAAPQQNDVTSSGGSNSPPSAGITKLEMIDLTASQDAFDDLASIVNISMGADSTVPSLDNDVNDLDWIDVKPLNSVSDVNLDNTMAPASVTTVMTSQQTQVMTMATLTRLNPISNPVMSQPYLQTSTPNIQGLLSGALHPTALPKVTHLQQRDPLHAPPPSYTGSILFNRLQGNPNSQIIKVDSTYDLMKPEFNGYSNGGNPADSLPHSTQNPHTNHVSTSDQALHRRLTEMVGGQARPVKSKKSRPNKSSSNSVSSAVVNTAVAAVNSSDANRKMMHHCPKCQRPFLNKSNIKVHMRTHTGEKPFRCQHCHKTFRQKAHLLKHMSIHKRSSRD